MKDISKCKIDEKYATCNTMLKGKMRCHAPRKNVVQKPNAMLHAKMQCKTPCENAVLCSTRKVKSNKRPVIHVGTMFAQALKVI